MNDRLKYRIWNKLTNSYTTGGCLKFGQMCFVSVETDEEEIETNIKPAEDQDNYIIEQCTGLKDKNGNLIYEGDIVICDRDFQEGRVGLERVVVFSDTAFHLQRKDGTDRYYMDMFHNFEIIGNIHEQAEQKD